MDCVRLALVNLYKASSRQAHQKRFFLCVFTIYSYNRNPIYKLSTAFKRTERNRTEHVEGDLIVRARLLFGMHGLSRLFSLKPWKLRHPWRQSGISDSLLLHIWRLQSTAHLKPFLRNFFVYEKHVRYTPGWSNLSFQDLVMDFQRLFYTNHEFENRTFDWVRLIFFLFGEFDFVRLPNSIELNPWIEFDWVRLNSIEI